MQTVASPPSPARMRERPPFARAPVITAMAVLAVVLTATSPFYGFHRDELYFRMLPPAWGYVDQPPLTPLLARLLSGLVDEPWMLRVPATLSAVAAVLVLALITREVGGSRRAQALSAWAAATAGFPLVFGHLLLSASVDLVAWPLVVLFLLRAVLRDQPRWWLAVGLVIGLCTYNKLLVGMLVAGLALGLALLGPWRLLRSPWLWAGVGIAVLVAAPNIVYQAANEWPQLRMGAALGEENGDEVRALTIPYLGLLAGPLLTPIWIAGIVSLLRRRDLRPVRFIVVAVPVVVIATIVGGAQAYYPLGIILVMLAVGCVPIADWMTTRVRQALVWAAVALNGLVSALIGLPLVPVDALGATPIPAVNEATADTVGWPRYVDQIAAVVQSSGDRPVVVTSNYGEAGAVSRFGADAGIDDVAYSGHNELWFLRRPPESATAAVFVGEIGPIVRGAFETCTEEATLDNGLGVDNEEQGLPVWLCTGRTEPWSTLWPRLAHLD